MMERCLIRNARTTDFAVIYNFINQLEDTVFPEQVQRAIFEASIASTQNVCLVAEHDNEVVAYISCHGQYLMHHGGLVGEIQELFVRGDKRGAGLGSYLVEELKKIAHEKGMIQLEVTANNSRTTTHSFYQRENFRLTHKKFVHPLIP